MKKILSLCLACIMLLAFASCGNSGVETPVGMQLASDPDTCSYYLFVPQDWTVDIRTATTTAYYSENDPSSICASFAQLNAENAQDPDAYFESYKSEFAAVFGELKDLQTDNPTLDGKPAKQYIYTAMLGETEYKFWQVICIRAGMVYTITYTSITENFEKHADDMQACLDSFLFA